MTFEEYKMKVRASFVDTFANMPIDVDRFELTRRLSNEMTQCEEGYRNNTDPKEVAVNIGKAIGYMQKKVC